ncbi:ATP-binding protein [Planktothrix sp. FACHB-1355]|uniref:ATP-binding protein n=2 Tax=Oscillatoriophycideae TaxID=1301283 RepID=A0A926VJE8_9CYAN|nr:MULTISPECIES: AAA family ATPase [Oscillatoriales]MBD2184293.1 ATP-binding protein [Aerosakkonema funiforme FACHB-1375]MBD3562713.1 ATP-binding protein [Planktothrix sp. FACHB-1355]
MAETTKIRKPEDAIAHLPHFDALLPLLRRLDRHLGRAIAAIEVDRHPNAPIHLYRELQANLQQIEKLSVTQPSSNGFKGEAENLDKSLPDFVPPDSHLAQLQQTFKLSTFDLDAIAIVLAPELDRRYERLYAYVQDEERYLQPTVDLVLKILCPTATDKLSQRDRFSPDAPLIRHKLLYLVGNSNQAKPSLLAHNILLDEQVVRFLLNEKGLDSRLTPFCQLIQPAVDWNDLRLKESVKHGLKAIAQAGRGKGEKGKKGVEGNLGSQQNPVALEECPSDGEIGERKNGTMDKSPLPPERSDLRLYFQGSDRALARHTAEAIAAELQIPLLTADFARIIAAKVDFEPTLKLILRQAWFENTLLYLEGVEILQEEEHAILYQDLLNAIAQTKGITILAGKQPWKPGIEGVLGILTIPFTVPDFTQRRLEWQERLEEAGISISPTDLDALSDRFRLTPEQIANAVVTASNTIRWKAAAGETEISYSSIVFSATRAQGGHDLAALARKVEPKYRWDDIVLPPDAQTQLREICNQAKHRHLVYEEWGFDRKLSLGKGQNVLFSGLPGTGKTMAAEVMASELQLDLYKIDLSQIVSKYIGDTEKNLNRIFNAAATSNAILLFDEADSLFGKRTEVKESRDRYANIEVGYLLQKMEEYEGIAILTTNVRSNIDDAFVRRLRFIVEFPLPTEKQRRQIWEKIWPDTTPRSPHIDLDFLARKFEIGGASIRNVALAAAFLAADEGIPVHMSHLIRAIRREYQKMGKILMEEELQHTGN